MKIPVLMGLIVLIPAFLMASDISEDLSDLYRRFQLNEIISILESNDFHDLNKTDQFLFIESLARKGEGFRALPLLNDLINTTEPCDALYTLCGIVYHAVGNIDHALDFFRLAINMNPNNFKALFSKSMLKLYIRDFHKAEYLYEKAIEKEPDLKNNYLYLIMGNRIYHANRDIEKMKFNYKRLHDYSISNCNEERALYNQYRIGLLKEYKGESLFDIDTSEDRIELPIYNFAENIPYKCLILELEDKEYQILLDTGNAPGWTVHDPDLLDLLPHILGGHGSISTGSVQHDLQSTYLITEEISFPGLSISNLIGFYFEKPRDNYFDANLNPIYIRNRVVTMDYINNKFILRTKEVFDKEISVFPEYSIIKLRFLGWEWPFIPVKVNNYARALAMIETGAEDISPSLEFAEFINMPIKPSVYEFRGEEYPNHIAELNLLLGNLQIHRPEVNIWPRRFFDTLTGLFHHIMIGPLALEGKYIIHFDPFDNQIFFQFEIPEKIE